MIKSHKSFMAGVTSAASAVLRRRAITFLIITVFGLMGTLLLVRSQAATFVKSAEAETGRLVGAAKIVDKADASGGRAVTFSAAAGTGGILFEDDFNGPAGSSFDTAKWGDYSACAYNGSAAYGNIKCGDNEKLDGSGHLVIPATPSSGSSIMTGDKFRFQYATISAWIKAPSQVGYWPAFWTLNNSASGPDTLPVGEIDVLEGYTTWNDVYHATAHNHTGNDATRSSAGDSRCAEGQGIDLSAGYNKYSAKVEPNKMTFYFNDVQCGAVFTPSTNPGKPWAFGPAVERGNWLILTLAVGGAGGQQKPATQNAQMLVDRVEVRRN